MLLQPKSFKYKKFQKKKLKNLEFKSNKISFGNIGLKALNSGTITARQIESARQVINRKIKRKGKIWIKIFPHLPITRKPAEVRMGKGKGAVHHWATRVKKGKILFEICGIAEQQAIVALKSGGSKLPISTDIAIL